MTAITIDIRDLLELKAYHQSALNLINKKLQEQDKKAGVSAPATRKGPVPAAQIANSKSKRLNRLYRNTTLKTS